MAIEFTLVEKKGEDPYFVWKDEHGYSKYFGLKRLYASGYIELVLTNKNISFRTEQPGDRQEDAELLSDLKRNRDLYRIRINGHPYEMDYALPDDVREWYWAHQDELSARLVDAFIRTLSEPAKAK